MTGPSQAFAIGQEVEITGPSILGDDRHLGEKFVISGLSTVTQHIPFSPYDGMYYPASSLRLVEPELKIGDWVQVVGPCGDEYIPDDDDPTIFKITEIREGKERTYRVLRSGRPGYPSSSLRKLTPEEVAKHTAPKLELSQETKDKIATVFEKAVDKAIAERYPLILGQLAAIQDRLKEDRNLMMEIEERFDERQDAIESDNEIMQKRLTKTEKLQADQHERMDGFMQDYREHKDFDFRMHDRIKVLEAYQRGEMPDCKPNDDLVAQRDYVLNRIAEDMMLLLDENFIVDSKMRAKEHVWLGELESLNERLDGMRGGKP